jgi:hypothetical protein
VKSYAESLRTPRITRTPRIGVVEAAVSAALKKMHAAIVEQAHRLPLPKYVSSCEHRCHRSKRASEGREQPRLLADYSFRQSRRLLLTEDLFGREFGAANR